MLRTPAYHRNRQIVRDSITNYTQVNKLGVRNMHDMHGATCTSQPQPKSLRIRLLSIEALGNPVSRGKSGPGRPGWLPTQVSGKEVTSPPPPPLRTARESF